jgi:exodeoxyribonuclease-5
MIDFIENKEQDFIVLTGSAGTGKSSTIQYLLDHLSKGTKVVFTGTTNKCTRVLKNMSVKKGMVVECVTIHSLLGLSMRTDANGKESLKSGGKSTFDNYDLVIVDECSMVNFELMSFIIRAMRYASGKTQVIFMGDSSQLNPVNENKSPVFAIDNQLKLTTVMRQANENPILALCTKIRENIDNKTYNVPNIMSATNEEGNIGVHVMHKDNFAAWMPSAFNTPEFEINPDSFRVIAWRNDTVNYYNSVIQKIRYPDLTMPFAIGEPVVFSNPMCAFSADEAYSIEKPVTEGWNKILCSTESEGVVKGVVEVQPFIFKPSESQIANGFNFRPFEIRRYMVTVDLFDGTQLTCAITADKKALKSMLEFIAKQIKAETTGMTWFVYYAAQKYFTELRSLYGVSSHKSQGSTYSNVFIDARDILTNPNREEALRCLYVAVSRATSNVVINV